MKIRNKNGITLIALVITIIVLLILAGVSIAMLTGENGILNQTKQAKEETIKAAENEKTDLAKTESQINQYTGNNTVDGVTIPEGFYYAGGNKDNGLVISDQKGDDLENAKQGNQFVWVPVEDFNEFKRQDFGIASQKWWTGNIVMDAPSENNMYEPSGDGIAAETEAQKMYKSVKENKGFYIARYEAGTTASTGKGIRGEVVSKKGANAYNFIGWNGTGATDTEAGGAVEVARSMYPGKSTLCYGVQWDAVLRWISKDENTVKYLTDSNGIGSYQKEVAIPTGSIEQFQLKHIYDMAGNVWDWTMETYGAGQKVTRGGSCYMYGGEIKPISYRDNNILNNSKFNIGFRVTLFI